MAVNSGKVDTNQESKGATAAKLVVRLLFGSLKIVPIASGISEVAEYAVENTIDKVDKATCNRRIAKLRHLGTEPEHARCAIDEIALSLTKHFAPDLQPDDSAQAEAAVKEDAKLVVKVVAVENVLDDIDHSKPAVVARTVLAALDIDVAPGTPQSPTPASHDDEVDRLNSELASAKEDLRLLKTQMDKLQGGADTAHKLAELDAKVSLLQTSSTKKNTAPRHGGGRSGGGQVQVQVDVGAHADDVEGLSGSNVTDVKVAYRNQEQIIALTKQVEELREALAAAQPSSPHKKKGLLRQFLK